MNKIAIDLTWVRHNKVGGTESCVRNLLDGFTQIDMSRWKIVLLFSKDNADSFKIYSCFNCFILCVCDVKSNNKVERIVWQNVKMGRYLKKMGVKFCLEPVYGQPFFGIKGIKFITTIHDLQAIHYPQYFNKGRTLWMKLSWINAVNNSERIVAISEYVKNDIEINYAKAKGKITVIYDAIHINDNEVANVEFLNKIGVEKKKYYYTVSSLFLHKNLKTIIFAIAELKKRKSQSFYPLVISGIGGVERNYLDELINNNNLNNDIIFTKFVNDDERNALYKNCKAFLFPSVFEGFGMPPLEAASFNVPVLTTKCTSIEEITGGILNYIEKPFDAESWANALETELKTPNRNLLNQLMSKYEKSVIAKKYIKLFNELAGE